MQRSVTSRSNISAAEVSARMSKYHTSAKSWVQGAQAGALLDAAAPGTTPAQARRIVGCTTWVATCMCAVIVVVKTALYMKSGAAVVKTWALESMGDLVASLIPLYTGYRMAKTDLKAYPIGQFRFESIGVLVFAVLMVALMLYNAAENFASLLGEQEKMREAAVLDFWTALFGTPTAAEAGRVEWVDPEAGFRNFRQVVTNTDGLSSLLKAALDSDRHCFQCATAAIQDKIDLVTEAETDAMIKDTLIFQNLVFGVSALYKLGMWLYCILYAIPRSGSTVLYALATDHRNDCFATWFTIVCTVAGYVFRDDIDRMYKGGAEKIDPLCSLLLSVVIIWIWIGLAVEQVRDLDMHGVEPELHESLELSLRDVLSEHDGRTFDLEFRAYYSSPKYTAEVDLQVGSPEIPFSKVLVAMALMRDSLNESEQVERTIVVPTLV